MERTEPPPTSIQNTVPEGTDQDLDIDIFFDQANTPQTAPKAGQAVFNVKQLELRKKKPTAVEEDRVAVFVNSTTNNGWDDALGLEDLAQQQVVVVPTPPSLTARNVTPPTTVTPHGLRIGTAAQLKKKKAAADEDDFMDWGKF
jgi:hypothetical protein